MPLQRNDGIKRRASCCSAVHVMHVYFAGARPTSLKKRYRHHLVLAPSHKDGALHPLQALTCRATETYSHLCEPPLKRSRGKKSHSSWVDVDIACGYTDSEADKGHQDGEQGNNEPDVKTSRSGAVCVLEVVVVEVDVVSVPPELYERLALSESASCLLCG